MSITNEQAEELRNLMCSIIDMARANDPELLTMVQDYYNYVFELNNEEVIYPVNFIGFKRVINFTGFVPVLGPVKHEELL